MSTATRPTLSVVVVTRNEAEHIEDCLSSVLDLCRDGPPFEVILVDSNSTDDTVELASEYPVTILQIPDDDLSTPGAGRYVGTHHASGDYILFVDGDMEVVGGWLGDALELVQRDSTAGVTGHLNEVPGDTPTTPVGEATGPPIEQPVTSAADPPEPTAPTPSTEADALSDGGVTHFTTKADSIGARDEREIRDVDALRGIALYDAAILDEVGGFDPHLLASEDVDVGYRLRSEGYHILRLPYVVASHPSDISLTEPFRRWRNGYLHGAGQSLRKGSDDPSIVASHLLALRHPILAAVWGGIGLLVGSRSRRTLTAWAAITGIVVGTHAARTDVRTTVVHTMSNTLNLFGLVLGWLQPPPSPEEYPLERVVVVQSDSRLT